MHAHKLPKKFSTLVPKLSMRTGKVLVNKSTREPIFVEEWAEYTCYIHAHRSRWKIKSIIDNKGLMQDISKKHRKSIG